MMNIDELAESFLNVFPTNPAIPACELIDADHSGFEEAGFVEGKFASKSWVEISHERGWVRDDFLSSMTDRAFLYYLPGMLLAFARRSPESDTLEAHVIYDLLGMLCPNSEEYRFREIANPFNKEQLCSLRKYYLDRHSDAATIDPRVKMLLGCIDAQLASSG
jgi:hypothetical protein